MAKEIDQSTEGGQTCRLGCDQVKFESISNGRKILGCPDDVASDLIEMPALPARVEVSS